RGLLQTHFVCRALKMSFLEYYAKCIFRSWLVVAAVWGLAQIVDWRSIITGWVSLCAVSVGLLLFYGLLLFLFVLGAEERSQFKRKSFRLMGKLGLGYNADSPLRRS